MLFIYVYEMDIKIDEFQHEISSVFYGKYESLTPLE